MENEEAVFPGLSSVRYVRRVIFDETWGVSSVPLGCLRGPEARAAMPGLLASYQSAGRSGAPEVWLALSARPQFLDILLAAPAGEVDPDLEPDDVFDLLLGAILARTLVPTVAQRNRPVERLVDLVLRLLHPAAARANASS